MINDKFTIDYRKFAILILILLAILNISVMFNLGFVRPVLSFIFLTFIPGLILIHIFPLNINNTEKLILSVGLSISFALIIGILANQLSYFANYTYQLSLTSIISNIGHIKSFLSPISLISLLSLILIYVFPVKIKNTLKIILSVVLSISLVFLIGILTNIFSYLPSYINPLSLTSIIMAYNIFVPLLLLVSYLRNKNKSFEFNLKIEENQLLYYLIPLFFPILTIMGTLLMNKWNINIINLLVLLLIPLYVIFISLSRSKISNKVYPYSLFLIGLSLLLMYALRSNYIVFGADTDWEYYLYHMTLTKEYWTNFTNVTYDSCISISILPTIYQKISGMDSEFLFRILYPILFSISPLIIYSTARKYLGEYYSFLSSFIFISFYQFFTTNNRIDIALIFFGLIIFTMVSDKINDYHKKFLLIIFLISITLSHYTTTFIALGILISTFLFTFLIEKMKLLNVYTHVRASNLIREVYKKKLKKPNFNLNKHVTLNLVLIFIALIFLWNGLINEVSLISLITFFQKASINIDSIFLLHLGNNVIKASLGQSGYYSGIPGKIELLLSWLIVFLTSIGILGYVLQRIIKIDFLKNHFRNVNLEFVIMSSVGFIYLTISFLFPFISTGYNILRTFFQMLFLLNIFFIIGAFFPINFFRKLFKKDLELSESTKSIILLLMIIPYFMCTTGMMYQLFDDDKSILLNSDGKEYDAIYIHDQEIMGAKWLKIYGLENKTINTDYLGRFRVIIGGLIDPHPSSVDNNITKQYSDAYIFLRYYNVVDKRILVFNSESDIADVTLDSFNYKFNNKSKLYDNGGTQIFL